MLPPECTFNRQDMERAVDGRLAPVTKLDGEMGELRTGDRYLLALAGPWNAPVRVIASDDTSFRFGTLGGHLQAELWVRMCERFIHVVDGRQIGPAQITTERTRS